MFQTTGTRDRFENDRLGRSAPSKIDRLGETREPRIFSLRALSLSHSSRHERDALISYFSRNTSDNPGFQDSLEKFKWLRYVQRLATYRVMHEDLVPFLWPAANTRLSKNYWEWAKERMEGQNVWKDS